MIIVSPNLVISLIPGEMIFVRTPSSEKYTGIECDEKGELSIAELGPNIVESILKENPTSVLSGIPRMIVHLFAYHENRLLPEKIIDHLGAKTANLLRQSCAGLKDLGFTDSEIEEINKILSKYNITLP